MRDRLYSVYRLDMIQASSVRDPLPAFGRYGVILLSRSTGYKVDQLDWTTDYITETDKTD